MSSHHSIPQPKIEKSHWLMEEFLLGAKMRFAYNVYVIFEYVNIWIFSESKICLHGKQLSEILIAFVEPMLIPRTILNLVVLIKLLPVPIRDQAIRADFRDNPLMPMFTLISFQHNKLIEINQRNIILNVHDAYNHYYYVYTQKSWQRVII